MEVAAENVAHEAENVARTNDWMELRNAAGGLGEGGRGPMCRFKNALVAFVLLGGVVSTTGCSGASSGNAVVEVGLSSETSALQSSAAAQPGASPATTSGDASLRITLRELRVHVTSDADGTSQGASESKGKPADVGANAMDATSADDASGTGWVTVFSGSQAIDLTNASDVEALLGSQHVPSGRVTQVRLVLADNATYVANGVSQAVTCPSCTTSGLKVVLPGAADLAADGTMHITLAIDLSKSLVTEGGALHLKPVLRVARTDRR